MFPRCKIDTIYGGYLASFNIQVVYDPLIKAGAHLNFPSVQTAQSDSKIRFAVCPHPEMSNTPPICFLKYYLDRTVGDAGCVLYDLGQTTVLYKTPISS
jgi:hypothetical protein